MSSIVLGDKENFQEPSSNITPHGSPTGKMWDSNDPLRNPPPLPVSPQMLKIKNTNVSSRTSSPGKLSFIQGDNGEVEYQLKKLMDSQSFLKKLIQEIDSSVKTTQIDLDNLVSRSTNNNSHLKDLLQNFAGSNGKNITEDKLEKLLEVSVSPLAQKLQSLNKASDQLMQKVTSLKEGQNTIDETIMQKIDSENKQIKDTLNKLIPIAEANKLNSIHEKLDSNKESFESISNTTLDAVKSFSLKLENNSKDLKTIIQKTNEQHEELKLSISTVSQNQDIMPKLEELNSSLSAINNLISKSDSSDRDVLSNDHLKENSQTIIDSISQTFSEKFNDNDSKIDFFSKTLQENLGTGDSKLDSISQSINDKFSNSDNKLDSVSKLISERFACNDIKIESMSQLVSERFGNSDSKLYSVTQMISERFGIIEPQFEKLQVELSSLKDTKLHQEINSKDMEIELKNKEIQELKRKLSEESSKHDLKESILELTTKKVQLETRFELLNEAYEKRYKEFQQLHNDHNDLITQMSNINIDKLTTIIGSAKLSKYSSSNDTLSTSPKKQTSSNRIMSTNSYLTNVNVRTPKNIKKYDLESVENSEDQENP